MEALIVLLKFHVDYVGSEIQINRLLATLYNQQYVANYNLTSAQRHYPFWRLSRGDPRCFNWALKTGDRQLLLESLEDDRPLNLRILKALINRAGWAFALIGTRYLCGSIDLALELNRLDLVEEMIKQCNNNCCLLILIQMGKKNPRTLALAAKHWTKELQIQAAYRAFEVGDLEYCAKIICAKKMAPSAWPVELQLLASLVY